MLWASSKLESGGLAMLSGRKPAKSPRECHSPSQSTRVPNLSAPIRDALAPFGLSDREAQVALALMAHLRVSETAERFGLSRSAVGTYRRRLFDKLGTSGECAARALLESTIGDIDLIPDEAEAAHARLSEKKKLGSICVGISLASIAMHTALLTLKRDSANFLLKEQEAGLVVAMLFIGLLLITACKFARKRVTAVEYEAAAAVCGLLYIIESTRCFSLADGTLSWQAVYHGLGALVWATMLVGSVGLVFVNVSPSGKDLNIPAATISGALTFSGYLVLWHLGISLWALATTISAIATFATILHLRSLPFILKGERGRKFNLQWDSRYAGALAGTAACFAFACAKALDAIPWTSTVWAIILPVAFFTLLMGIASLFQRLEAKLELATDAFLLLTCSALMVGVGCGIAMSEIRVFKGAQWLTVAFGIAFMAMAKAEVRRIVLARSSFLSLDKPEAVALSLKARGIELTRAEKLVLAAVADGLDATQIAERLVVSKSTVNSHLHHAFKKCDVNTLEELRLILKNADDLCVGRR